MRFWVISDTHIGHHKMLQFGRDADFEEQICRNWQNLVGEEDTVIHLGDVFFRGSRHLDRILDLPGRKILVMGNHDMRSASSYMDRGFALACDSLVMRFEKVSVLFSHCPKYSHPYDINIHGHTHDIFRASSRRLHLPIALEVSGYRPIEIDRRFVSFLRRWKDRFEKTGKIPSVNEIIEITGTAPKAVKHKLSPEGLMMRDGEASRQMRAMSERLIAELGSITELQEVECRKVVNEYLRGSLNENDARQRLREITGQEEADAMISPSMR